LFSTVLARVAERHDCTRVLEVNAPLVDEQREHRVLVDEAGAEAAVRAQVEAADVVACVSEPVADWVRARAPRTADVRATPNGVNTHRITPVTPDVDGVPVVVFVGTLKPWHGVESLLEAAALAQERWRVRIVGDGPQRPVVEALAAHHGLDVHMVGAVSPDDVPAALEGASVAVAPYPDSADHYFSPLKVYEYGAAALPVVASRIGQIPQIVVDGATGVLVPPSDPAALAAAVDALVADPGRARRLGAAARRRMESRHSWDTVLEQSLPAPVEVSA
jgi:glycosyltransferase involved in cell wall biosynthesis